MGDGLKSAYERAMERLKEKGLEPADTTLTDEQSTKSARYGGNSTLR